MSAAAVAQYASDMVRYDPQAMQQVRAVAAQSDVAERERNLVQRNRDHTPAERTLEGEILKEERQQQTQAQQPSEEEYLARHHEERARSNEGYQSPTQHAIAAYQTAAQLTHPADVDRVAYVDVYA